MVKYSALSLSLIFFAETIIPPSDIDNDIQGVVTVPLAGPDLVGQECFSCLFVSPREMKLNSVKRYINIQKVSYAKITYLPFVPTVRTNVVLLYCKRDTVWSIYR